MNYAKVIFGIAVLFCGFNYGIGQVQTQTYSAGSIPLGGNTAADECSAGLSFSIPPGSTVDSIRVWYDASAVGAGYRSDARTRISCLEGTAEAAYVAGTLTGVGIESYTRLISPLFTGVTATGNLNFTLFAWDSYNPAASCAGGNDLSINNSSWVISVYYTAPPIPFSYNSSTTTQSNTSDVAHCLQDQEIIGVEVVTDGNTGVFNLTQFDINMNGTTSLPDATNIDIYYTGDNASYSAIGYFGSATVSGGTITVNGSQQLVAGVNHFWVAYDMLAGVYTGGNAMDAECTRVRVDGVDYIPSITNPGSGRTTVSCPTAPGNVSSGLQFWLKANQTNGTDGNLTSSWTDHSGNANNATQANTAQQPYYRDNPGSNLNFNSAVEFIKDNGNSANNDRLDFMTPARNTQNVFLAFRTSQLFPTASWHYDAPLLYGGDVNPGVINGESDFMIGFGDWAGSGDALSFGGGGNVDWFHNSSTVVSTGLPTILEVNRTDISSGQMQLGWRKNGLSGGTHNQILAFCADPMPQMCAIGTQPSTPTAAYDGVMSEVVVYDNVLSAADRNRVESYLAIKYGVTLDQSVGQNYVLSDGTIVWDAGVVPAGYDNDIAGISRDDASAQLQKQSKSINPGSVVTIGLGPIAATNSANTANFGADGQTLVWSNDRAAMNWVIPETPVGLSMKLEREWYVEENNGDVGTVTIEVNNADLPPVAGSIVHLLVDADGDFSSGALISPMTLNGAVWTVDENLPNDYYFSFAINPVPLPVELTQFHATPVKSIVKLDWVTATEINNDFFTVERSINGLDWEEVLERKGQGNSQTTSIYTDYDEAPHAGLSYYRLKQTDLNGKFDYSDVRKVMFDANELRVYPNPAKEQIFVEGNWNSLDELEVYDMSGRRLMSQINISVLSTSRVSMDISKLSRGVYTIKYGQTSERFIIE